MRAYVIAGMNRPVRVCRSAHRFEARLLSVTAISAALLLVYHFSRPSAVMASGIRPIADDGSNTRAVIESSALKLSCDHGYLVLTGEARNVTRRALPRVEAVVEFFDESGRLVTVETGLVKLGGIAAGDQTPFEVQARDDSSVASYRLRFRSVAGSVLPSRIEI